MAKILLVEDEKANRDVLAKRLTKRGHDVVKAANGVEACALVRLEPPDLILMDAQMPEMDGYEATRRLKAEPATHHIPIIALTAHVISDEREKALAAGCNDFHGKPIQFQELLLQIDAVLAKGRTT